MCVREEGCVRMQVCIFKDLGGGSLGDELVYRDCGTKLHPSGFNKKLFSPKSSFEVWTEEQHMGNKWK